MSALTPFRFFAILILFELSYTLFATIRSPRWDCFLIGDCPYYAATAESLIQDGDWDIRNQLPGDLEEHEGFFALSQDNRIVPKHSTLLPLLSVPFVLIMGKAGFLFVNLLQVFALITGIMFLAGGGPAARLLALVGYLSTPFLTYTYNYSPDILAAVLITWSYVCASTNRPLLCGLLAGLAIWAKIYMAIVVAPLPFLCIRRDVRAMVSCCFAALFAIAPMVAINTHLFGSPWLMGYDRDARITPQGFTVTEHYSRFNQPFFDRLGNLLFDNRIGMLQTAPLWFLWPVGLCIGLKNRQTVRWLLLAMTLSLLLNLVIFAPYDEWNASKLGNRFLFPALALGLALQGPMWRMVLARREQVAPPVKSD